MLRKPTLLNSFWLVVLVGSLLMAACAPEVAGLAVDRAGQSPQGARALETEIEPTHTPEPSASPTLTGTPDGSPTPEPSVTPLPGQEIEFRGRLTAINENVWTVGDHDVLVTRETEIKGNPQVGDIVKVHARLRDDGVLVAREIEVEDEDERPGEEVEFTGRLTAINENVWTVGDRDVLVTRETEIKGDPQVGDQVKVHALVQADGSLVAREIEKENSGPGGGSGDDDHSGGGNGGSDDNSGSGSSGDDHDGDDDQSGSGGGDDDDDHSGPGGGGDDNDDDDDSGSGGSGSG